MAQVRIKRGIEWVPGGMMVVPLLIGSVVTAILVPLVTHWWATRIQSAAVSAGALPPDAGGIGDLRGMPTTKEHAAGRGKIGLQADRR